MWIVIRGPPVRKPVSSLWRDAQCFKRARRGLVFGVQMQCFPKVSNRVIYAPQALIENPLIEAAAGVGGLQVQRGGQIRQRPSQIAFLT